jgi:hypothetical protein
MLLCRVLRTVPMLTRVSWDNSVCVVTRLDDWGAAYRGRRLLLFPQRPNRLYSPPFLLYNGYYGCFPGLKRQKHEADHSPLSSAEVDNDRAIPSLLHTSSRRGMNLHLPYRHLFGESDEHAGQNLQRGSCGTFAVLLALNVNFVKAHFLCLNKTSPKVREVWNCFRSAISITLTLAE